MSISCFAGGDHFRNFGVKPRRHAKHEKEIMTALVGSALVDQGFKLFFLVVDLVDAETQQNTTNGKLIPSTVEHSCN